MNSKGQAKVLADLLRHFLLQIGKDWKQAPATYERYASWIQASPELLLNGNTPHHRILDLYTHWREQAGLGPERDVYLQQEPGDREKPLAPAWPFSVLAHNLRSAYNVGSIIRSLDCFGLDQIHWSGYTPSPEHPALRSAARGCENWIPNQHWEDPFACITNSEVVLPAKGLLLVGNEELGIAPELLETCTLKIQIPMMGRKASLNVANAFAVFAYALRTQGQG